MAFVKMATRYAFGWSNPMGGLAGGINMITGKTEPMNEQPYDEWLMEMLVKFGVGTTFTVPIPYSKGTASMAIGHVEHISVEEVNGFHSEYKLTPKAKRYLEIMNKENE